MSATIDASLLLNDVLSVLLLLLLRDGLELNLAWAGIKRAKEIVDTNSSLLF